MIRDIFLNKKCTRYAKNEFCTTLNKKKEQSKFYQKQDFWYLNGKNEYEITTDVVLKWYLIIIDIVSSIGKHFHCAARRKWVTSFILENSFFLRPHFSNIGL